MQIIKTSTKYHYTSIALTHDDIKGIKLKYDTIDYGMIRILQGKFATCPVVQTADSLAVDHDFRIRLIQELGKKIGLNSEIERHVVDFEQHGSIGEYIAFIERFCLLVIKWDDPFEAALHKLNPCILYGVD